MVLYGPFSRSTLKISMATLKTMASLLEELERELQALGLWQTESPTLKQLSSREPFSVDILTPQQWLQWIFIPKMGALIEANHGLPSGFEVTPYFEQVWQQQPGYANVLTILQRIDQESHK